MIEHLGYDKPEKTEAEVGQQIHRITRALVKRANKMAPALEPGDERHLNKIDSGDTRIYSSTIFPGSTYLNGPLQIASGKRDSRGSDYHQATSEHKGAATLTIKGDEINSHTGKFLYYDGDVLKGAPEASIGETIHESALSLSAIRNDVAEAEIQHKHSKAA